MTQPVDPLVLDATQAPVGEHLLGHVLRFGRVLRLMGLPVSLRQVLDLSAALAVVPMTVEEDFYHACRSLLVTRHEDLPVFDDAFDLFWRAFRAVPAGPDDTGPVRRPRLPGEPGAAAGGGSHGDESAAAPGAEGDNAGQHAVQAFIARYSPLEILRDKDFGQMTWEEIQAAKAALRRLRWQIAPRTTRRYHADTRGRLDMRRMTRGNLVYGGEPLTLAYRARKRRPRPLVVICDISGSMDRYSRMLLHFVHTFMHGLTGVEVEAFVFGTRLTRITHHLRHKDVDVALDEVAHAVTDWAGGTRIGEAVRAFNLRWARRVLGRGAVVLVISDGWDRGDVVLLTREMARLQRMAYRLMWLNPLIGAAQYTPSQRGMAAALEYVDDLLSGCNLAGLEQLAQVLSAIPADRPARRQHPHLSPDELAGDGAGQGLAEHPFTSVVKEYPWLNIFTELGRRNNHEPG